MEQTKHTGAVEPLKVMLVDDEPLAVETMKTLVDWESLGFSIVATAENGKQGLQAFARHRPDVVFIDIDMPIMNGIQFLSELKQVDASVVAVILSAHSKFEYAQKVISAGALDYVIKEDMTGASLTALLERIDRHIVASHTERAYLLERYVGEVFNSPDEEYLEMMQSDAFLRSRFSNNSTFVLCELDVPLPIIGKPVSRSERFGSRERKCIRAFRHGSIFVASIGMVSDTRLALELAVDGQSTRRPEDAIRAFAHQLQDRLMDELGRSVSIFTTHGAKGLYHAAAQYQQYRGNITGKYLVGTRLLMPLDDKRLVANGPGERLEAATLFTRIEKWEYRQAIADVRRAFAAEKADGSYTGLVYLFDLCVAALMRYGGEADSYKVLDAEAQRMCVDADGICEWVCLRLERMAAQLESQSDYSREVRRAIEYIRANYADPNLSNQKVAEHTGLSGSHMGYLFKKETGRTLVDYLTEVRIEAAKALLADGNAKIYQVAGQVGYGSSQYFSQVFLRIVGQKPIEYQKQVT